MTSSQQAFSYAAKTIVIGALAVAWWLAYTRINHWNAGRDRAVFLAPRPADLFPWVIQPITAPIYVGAVAVLLTWALAIYFPSPALWRLIVAILIGTVIGFACFALWPLNIKRPPFSGDQFGERLMRAVFAWDESANCFPSFHAFFAVLCAIAIAAESESKLAVSVAWCLAVLVLATTITTGQHYLIDVPAGLGLAWFAFFLSGVLIPKSGG